MANNILDGAKDLVLWGELQRNQFVLDKVSRLRGDNPDHFSNDLHNSNMNDQALKALERRMGGEPNVAQKAFAYATSLVPSLSQNTPEKRQQLAEENIQHSYEEFLEKSKKNAIDNTDVNQEPSMSPRTMGLR